MHRALNRALNRFKQAPKYLRIFTYLLLTYACYALLLGLLVPAVLQSQAPKKLSEMLGREVRIKQVSINPFLLRARIHGFEIKDQDNNRDFASLQQVELEFSFWRSLGQMTPNMDHLYIEQPKINIEKLASSTDAPRFNFSDIVEHMAAQQSGDTPQGSDNAASGIPAFRARDIQINQGSFSFDDQLTGAKLHYKPLDVSLKQLDTQALTLSLPQSTSTDNNKPALNPEANQYAFAVTGADQGKVQLKGQFQLQPLEVSGDLTVDKVTLSPFWPFAAKLIKAKLHNGDISFESQFNLKQQDQQFSFDTNNGHFRLANLVFNDNETPKVKLPKLILDDIALSSATQSVDVQALQVQGLWVDAALSNKGLDLERLFMPMSQKGSERSVAKAHTLPKQDSTDTATGNNAVNSEDADNTESNDWRVRLNHFEMSDTDLNLTEHLVSEGVHWRVYPLSLSTGTVLSDLSQPIEYKLSLDVGSDTKNQPAKARGQFASRGSLDAKSLAVDGKLQLTDIDLNQFQPYLKPYLNLQLARGSFSTSGDFTANNSGNVVYQGQVGMGNLLIKDNLKNQPLLKWQQMSINSLKFDLQNKRLKMDTIHFDAPYAKVLIAKDRRTNISEILVSAPEVTENHSQRKTASAKPTETPEGQEFAIDIGRIQFAKGSAYFADNSLTPNFATGIEYLEGHISQLSSTPGTKALVDIKGKIDKYAPVTLQGEINPLLESPYLDLDLIFKSVELTSVNPYSDTYAGYYIDKGQMSLALNYQLENNQLKGNNHLVIDQLTLGKPSDSKLATNLPLKLAIALLQDRHGVIDLGLEVSGDLDSPDFSFGSIIMTAVTNVITKAVTSPFSLLAGLVDSDEELNHVQFQPGLATLDDTNKDRLSKLAKALDDRPNLKISIEGAVDLSEDSQVLAEQKLQQLLHSASGLESLPQDLSASRFPISGPLAKALESLFVQQLDLNINDEQAKVTQQLKEKADGGEVTPEQVATVLHIGMYNQLIRAQEVSHNKLGKLAEVRAQTIKAFLVNNNNISPDRVFLLDSKTELKTDSAGAKLTLRAD